MKTFSRLVYDAFVLDVCSRMDVGWQISTRLYSDLALDTLRMGIWLRERAAVASVGSKDDSYDDAMAEALNLLYKAELTRNHGPWAGINDLEIVTAERVDWYNQRRLHGVLSQVPPTEHESLYWALESQLSFTKTR